MNALLSTIDIKLATLIRAGLYSLHLTASTSQWYRDEDPTVIGSRKVAAILHPEEYCCAACKQNSTNRYKRARIYKKGKVVRTTDKFALADAVNFESVTIEEDVVEWEPMTAFVEANLICGCEVTILEDGTEYINQCESRRCYSFVPPQ